MFLSSLTLLVYHCFTTAFCAPAFDVHHYESRCVGLLREQAERYDITSTIAPVWPHGKPVWW